MFCIHCGQSILHGSKFCSHCGTPVVKVETEICLPQNEPVPAQFQYSPVCSPVPQKNGTLRIPLLILAGLCVMGLFLFALFPGEDASQFHHSSPFTCVDGYLYFDETAYSGSDELTVPTEVDGELITHIGKHCFYNCDSLTTVFLPNSVQYIEDQAFYGSDRLRGIAIPDGVLFIGTEAFADCDKLEAITIPITVEYLAASAFEDCDELKYVFYSGTVEQWNLLFDGVYDSDAIVYCSDGQCPLKWIE